MDVEAQHTKGPKRHNNQDTERQWIQNEFQNRQMYAPNHKERPKNSNWPHKNKYIKQLYIVKTHTYWRDRKSLSYYNKYWTYN